MRRTESPDSVRCVFTPLLRETRGSVWQPIKFDARSSRSRRFNAGIVRAFCSEGPGALEQSIAMSNPLSQTSAGSLRSQTFA
jgi:hypothetical protein